MKIKYNFHLKRMSFLQKLLEVKESYDTELISLGLDPKTFKTDRDKFIFLAKKGVEYGIIPKNEVLLINEPSFAKAVHECNSLFDIALYVISKIRSEKKVKFGQNNVKEFMSNESSSKVNDNLTLDQLNDLPWTNHIKMKTNDSERDQYLDLNLLFETGKVEYITSENKGSNILFEINTDSEISERSDENHENTLLFAYPEPDFYKEKSRPDYNDKLNEYYSFIRYLLTAKSKNPNNDTFMMYDKYLPLKHPSNDGFDDKYLDIDLFIRTGKVSYLTDEDYYDMDEDNQKTFFYLLPNGSILEKNQIGFGNKEAYLFVYPTPEFYDNQENYDLSIYNDMVESYYDSIKNRINEYLKHFIYSN